MSRYNAFFKIGAFTLIVPLLLSLCACKKEDEKNSEFDLKNKKATSSSSESSKEDVTPELADNPVDFENLNATNPNIIAWIKIPGTENIDYPVMMSEPEMDDNFYIDHDVDGNKTRAGSLYAQKHNSKAFDDPNTVIYGHNMGNGSMFGHLKKFRDEAFFNENKTIYIYIPGHILEYEIISAFVYDNRHILNSFEFNDPADRMIFFDTCVNPDSLTKQVREGATLDVDDRIITLSTCVPTGDENYRYLVIGKLIQDTPTK